MPQAGLPDLGARLVELFFVVSGFLVGFRNHGTFDESISGCWKYLWPKVRLLYPVYLLGLALGVLRHIMRGGWQIGADTVFPIVWALGLQQAWIPSIAMVYNGASWFISAWAFCMLCAPMLQWLLEQVRGALGETRGLIALFVLMLVVRAFLETCQALSPGVYPYSLHVTPFIRLLEFGAAYLIGVSFRGCRDGANRSFFFQTVMETAAIAGAFASVVLFDEVWPRWAFVLLWIIVVPILAGGGWPNKPLAVVEAVGLMWENRDGILFAPQRDNWDYSRSLFDIFPRWIQEGRSGLPAGNARPFHCVPSTVPQP